MGKAKLSPEMQRVMKVLEGAYPEWVNCFKAYPSIHGNTVSALKNRGLIEVTYRLMEHDPNKVPVLSRQQVLDHARFGLGILRDPWIRLRKEQPPRDRVRLLVYCPPVMPFWYIMRPWTVDEVAGRMGDPPCPEKVAERILEYVRVRMGIPVTKIVVEMRRCFLDRPLDKCLGPPMKFLVTATKSVEYKAEKIR